MIYYYGLNYLAVERSCSGSNFLGARLTLALCYLMPS